MTQHTKPLLILSTGEYSDYSWSGPYRPLKSFTMGEALAAFKTQWKPAHERAHPDTFAFEGWLISNGYIEQIEATEIHIGSYGELDVSEEAATEKLEPSA